MHCRNNKGGFGSKLISNGSYTEIHLFVEGSREFAIPIPQLTLTNRSDHVLVEWEVA